MARLWNEDFEPEAQKVLANLYESQKVAPEKKPFLVNLAKSQGPYLALENGSYILDGSSQVATLGLGFNPPEFSDLPRYSEELKNNYKNFLIEQTGWPKGFAHFCHSGTEANEIALGWAFENRINKNAKKILAFEGGFHGRMLVALGATWNPKKRLPYAWPSKMATFAPWPQLTLDHTTEEPPPSHWIDSWFSKAEFDDQKISRDKYLKEELRCIRAVRDSLKSQEFYAIILEPRQCEGGDRYGSRRFHQAICALAKHFKVPVIYDEVQCGISLGGPFFWHQLFNLKLATGEALYPDFVTCAKKAQMGVVLSHTPMNFPEEFSQFSMPRGFVQAQAMARGQNQISHIENLCRKNLLKIAAEFSEWVECPRVQGLSFSLDFKSVETRDACVKRRFREGLFYFAAGEKSIRFRLNLGYRDSDIELLFKQLSKSLSHLAGSENALGEFQEFELSNFLFDSKKQNPDLQNKICLSNFVNRHYVENLNKVIEALPPSLRHAFSANGQSECVDKLIKSIWAHRKIERVLAHRGSFFGAGSFMARALSGIGKEPYFLVDTFETVEKLKELLENNSYHSCWIEPVSQKSKKEIDSNFLTQVRDLTRKNSTPLVFCETAIAQQGFSKMQSLPSQKCEADAGYFYLGGQMGIAYLKQDLFVAKPLEIVSTWEGDAYSLDKFVTT